MKVIFIDGNVNGQNFIPEKGVKYYSFNKDDLNSIQKFEAKDSSKIKLELRSEIIEFYNNNVDLFKEFNDNTGINIWFLEHRRLNIDLIEENVRKRTLADFQQLYPKSEILTINKKQISLFHKFKRFYKELIFMYQNAKNYNPQNNNVLIFHDAVTENISEYRLFGNLVSEFPIFYTRATFNLKSKLPKLNLFRKNKAGNSDYYTYKRLFKIDTYLKLLFFYKKIKVLQKKVNYDCTPYAQQIFDNFFNKKFYFLILYIRFLSFNDLFEKFNDLKAIILSDENSPQQKIIQYSAYLNNIKFFAVQHGAIYYDHYSYNYHKYLLKPILPELTFLWGKHYYENLLKFGGYNASQLVVVGKIQSITFNNKTKTTNIVKRDKKIILYASQPLDNILLKRKFLSDIYTICKEMSNKYFLLIRPHHNDINLNIYYEEAKRIGFTNFCLEKGIDLKSHFEICDIMITYYSTVGAEFVEYYKPLLVLDYLHEDLIGLIRQGVGIKISKDSDLKSILSLNKIEIDRNKYQIFIENFFYKGRYPAFKLISKYVKNKIVE